MNEVVRNANERLRRIIWRCNGKYLAKGEKGCESRHIDDGVLYQAFVDVFNTLVENKERFIEKWRKRLESENALVRYKAKQFLKIITETGRIKEFDIDLYFALTEKVVVYADSRLTVSWLDSTEVECFIK